MRALEAIKREEISTRNQLSFLHSDRGGPDHSKEMDLLRGRLRELEAELTHRTELDEAEPECGRNAWTKGTQETR